MEKEKITRVVNTGEDKREAQGRRESGKTLLNVIAGVLIAIFCLFVGIGFSLDIDKLSKINKQKQSIPEIPIKVDYTGYTIVHKVSKDYRKYFVSYKIYYGKNKYHLKIKEITFEDFMTLQEGDTLSTTLSELNPVINDTCISNNN